MTAPEHIPTDAFGRRAITLAELISCSVEGKITVARRNDTGALLHIEDAVSGLDCNCSCVGCNRTMVAHRGKLRNHFQHRTGQVDCQAAGETALHKLAKELLADARRLLLPELKVTYGIQSRSVYDSKESSFDIVVLEKKTGSIVPDVICKIGGRTLHVEFLVTHACDEKKLSKIRHLDVGCIEIDLSGYRGLPLEDLREPILSKAPRVWLHNPKGAIVRTELVELEKVRVSDESKRVDDLLAQLPAVNNDLVGDWEQRAGAQDLSEYLDASREATGFLVPRREWQSFILVHVANKGRPFSHRQVFDAVRDAGLIAKGFLFVPTTDARALRKRLGGRIVMPWGAVRRFLTILQRDGLLRSGPGTDELVYAAQEKPVTAIASAVSSTVRPHRERTRTDILRDAVDAVMDKVRTIRLKDSYDFDEWFLADIGGIVPIEATKNDQSFATLFAQLAQLRDEMSEFPPRATMSLGLPVLEEVELRVQALKRAGVLPSE